MAWTVEFVPEEAQQLRKLDRAAASRITRYLRETFANGKDPRQRVQGLTANRAGLWRFRVGDFRVICQIEPARLLVLVLVVRVSY